MGNINHSLAAHPISPVTANAIYSQPSAGADYHTVLTNQVMQA